MKIRFKKCGGYGSEVELFSVGFDLNNKPATLKVAGSNVEPKGVKSNYFGEDLYKIKNPQP